MTVEKKSGNCISHHRLKVGAEGLDRQNCPNLLAKMAGCLCARILVFFFFTSYYSLFFKLFKIYDIPPTYFKLKKGTVKVIVLPLIPTSISLNSEKHLQEKNESYPVIHGFIITLLEPRLSIKEHHMYSFP